MNCDVVVAKYKEDTSWTEGIDNVKIYNKGPNGDIPNVGRESETFLRYIIEFYDKLPEIVLFLQGDPFGHVSPDVNRDNIKDKIKYKKFENPNWKIEPFYGIWLTEQSFIYPGIHYPEYYNFFFGKEMDGSSFSYIAGCQYFVKKSAILQNQKEFYVKIRDMLVKGNHIDATKAHSGFGPFDSSVMTPWAFERLFCQFFK
jgi:hypothetical protein